MKKLTLTILMSVAFLGIDALRHPQEGQSGTAAQGTHCRQISCPGEASAAAEQQNLAEAALVAPGIPVRKDSQHRLMIQNLRFHITDCTVLHTLRSGSP